MINKERISCLDICRRVETQWFLKQRLKLIVCALQLAHHAFADAFTDRLRRINPERRPCGDQARDKQDNSRYRERNTSGLQTWRFSAVLLLRQAGIVP